jgi:hypothetical protein
MAGIPRQSYPTCPEHILCRSPASGPVLVAGVLPASLPDLLHQFQPTSVTLDPLGGRLPHLR